MLKENTPTHLYEIWRHFDEGRWFLPTHQRKLVWESAKINNWFKTLKNIHKDGGGTVEGCIIIYCLPGESKIYLNDGAQRVYWTILKFIEHCKAEILDWKEILSSVKITVQSVQYKNISEAIKGFIQINFGTTATPFELSRTMMCELMEDYDKIWEPRLLRIQKIFRDSLLRMGAEIEDREDVSKRDLAHKRIRDEMNLFYKFISGDITSWSPQVALSHLKPDQWDTHTKLEKMLSDNLLKLGLKETDEKIEAFEKFIDELTAFYQQVWAEIRPSATRPANVHMRWWFVAVMYLRNNKMMHHLREFTTKLIKHSEGRTSIFYVNDAGKQCNCNTAMSNLKQIGMIFKIIGLEVKPKEKREKSSELLKKGFVQSHIEPFSIEGNGERLTENAIENRFRSAAPMTEEEKDRLKNIQ